MIKYPLKVTIDSNIFDSTKYDFSKGSTLDLLASHVENNKIKIYLSDIVYREVKKHIENKAQEIVGKARNLRAEILELASEDLVNAIELEYVLQIPDKKVVKQKAADDWENFIKRLKPEIFDYSGITIESILDDYFAINPPFESNEKKCKEFPDAFFAAQIREKFKDSDPVAIISKDKGFKKACGHTTNHLFFDSLGDLYNALNKRDKEYAAVVELVKKMFTSISEDVKDKILDTGCVEVFGMSVDHHGVSEGFEYKDFEIDSISPVTLSIHFIDNITDDLVVATLKCSVHIAVNCSFYDYSNSVWDNETRDYVFLNERTMHEEHDARFAVRVEINRHTSEYKLSSFKIFLGGDSRKERYEVFDEPDIDYYAEIEDMDRESVGLIPLGNYKNELESNLQESVFSDDLLKVFEDFNRCYSDAEKFCIPFADLVEKIKNADEDNKEKLILIFKYVFHKLSSIPNGIDIDDPASEKYEDWSEFESWIIEQYEILSNLSDASLPDCIEYGNSITILGIKDEQTLSLDEICINPSEGSEEIIDYTLTDSEGNRIACGYTKLLVGYIHFNDDGGVDDGLSDEISYHYDEIIEKLNIFVSDISKYISAQEDVSGYIDDAMKLYS